MSRETIRFADGTTSGVIYGGIVTIYYSTNETLIQQCKQLKRNFSQEFKDWFIWMKANFDNGLPLHGDRNDWWWVPAMRLHIPGIQFPGIDY
jgi:hypothetical protein